MYTLCKYNVMLINFFSFCCKFSEVVILKKKLVFLHSVNSSLIYIAEVLAFVFFS